MEQILVLLAPYLDQSEAAIFAFAGVFVRVGAVVALLPGFGEQTLPLRVRLAAAIAIAVIVWPMIVPELPDLTPGVLPLILALLAEAAAGLALGIAVRLMIMVLQLAGSIAAQATAIAQVMGAGVTPDPMPAIGNILVIAGIAVALAAGLHTKAAAMVAMSYEPLPFGRFLDGADLARWGTARIGQAFALAFTLAAPFVLASFLYNLALGAINRAMPQLMVAFVGAPAITAGALILMVVAGPAIVMVWSGHLDRVLADPLELAR